MTAYVDYTYYSVTYLGTVISSTDFARLALRATAQIDQITFDRASVIVAAATDTAQIDKIKMATCAIADEIKFSDDLGGADVLTSESIGGYSVSYGVASAKSQTFKQKISTAAQTHLWNTALMFRGFADGEYSSDADQC